MFEPRLGQWFREGPPAVASLPQHTLRLLLAEARHWGVGELAAHCVARLGAPGAMDEGAAILTTVLLTMATRAMDLYSLWIYTHYGYTHYGDTRYGSTRCGRAVVATRGDGARAAYPPCAALPARRAVALSDAQARYLVQEVGPIAKCPMPNAQCPMPCPTTNAQCPMPNAQCPMPYLPLPYQHGRPSAPCGRGLRPHYLPICLLNACTQARAPRGGGAARPQRGGGNRGVDGGAPARRC